MAQDVFSKMAEEPWLLNEDGYLNIDSDIKEIVYHPPLNVILICANSGLVRVLDVNSGLILQSSYLSAVHKENVTCRYIPGENRLLFCDGQAIGVRSDYNGVLLLDSILQKTVSNCSDDVILELPLSEAIILKQSLLAASISTNDHLVNELSQQIQNAQRLSKKGIKAQKWNTICLQLPLDSFRNATSTTVSELVMKNLHTPELGVASAVNERLSELTGEPINISDRNSMASEARRRETFSSWPHMDYQWALPDQMAQAGFYHLPNNSGEDRAMCFTCTVCLVSWEKTDEPWSEHERHSPSCPFVIGVYTQNVPLSVTHATNPAIDATYHNCRVSVLGTSSVSHLIPTANAEGLVSVFEVSGKLKRTHMFFVTQFDSHILERFTQDFGPFAFWGTADENQKCPVEKRITALSIISDGSNNSSINNNNQKWTTSTNVPKQSNNIASTYCTGNNNLSSWSTIRPTIVCAVNMKYEAQSSTVAASPSNANSVPTEEMQQHGKSVIYLVVYDFIYTKELDEMNNGQTNDMKMPTDSLDSQEESGTLDSAKISNLITNMDTSDATTMKYNILKQMKYFTNFYKFPLIPPNESDEVFLPPIPTLSKQYSGPRLVNLDTETDSFVANPFVMKPALADGKVTSISDHINDLKKEKSSSTSSKKLNYSRTVQCISIPESCGSMDQLEVSHILNTMDNKHILVVIKSLSDSRSFLVVYALNLTGKMVLLHEEPVLFKELQGHEKPLQVTTLVVPDKCLRNAASMATSSSFQYNATAVAAATQNEITGHILMVCEDGAVRIVEMATLRTACWAKLEGEKFISAAYCNSLDHLCAATKSGALHFYALNDADNESSEEHEDDEFVSEKMNHSTAANSSSSSTSNQQIASSTDLDSCDLNCFREPPTILSVVDLKRLLRLCEFEHLKPGYNAVVPPCWSETLQQRRHLQNLKGSDSCEQNMKTWRLQTDTTTWDEHIFEITLQNAASVGHVDVHFTLQNACSLPHVEITLLKHLTNGIGQKKDMRFSVDESVTIDMLQWAENPVVSQEYLRAQNAEILAGPINIAHHLDLTEKSGVISLTSPKLFKSKVRNLLLHIRAVYSKDDNNTKNSDSCSVPHRSSSIGNKQKMKSSSYLIGNSDKSKKTEFYMGCDCIHDVSVSIFATKQTDLLHERSQRNLMLESNVFVQSLLMTALHSDNEALMIALDLLNWVTAIRLTRNRSNNGEVPSQQLELIGVLQGNIEQLLCRCILLGSRSVAHKCMKLLVTAINGARSVNDVNLAKSIVINALKLMNDVHKIKSAAGLQWLFKLILEVVDKDMENIVVDICLQVLKKIANEMNQRSNDYHSLLRSRYGLYGTPLQPELFDVEPPPGKSSFISQQINSNNNHHNHHHGNSGASNSNNNHHNNNNNNNSPTGSPTYTDIFPNYSFNKEGICSKGVMSNGDVRLKGNVISPSVIVKGLIETELLHFTCIAASEGTRIERADSSSCSSPLPLYQSGTQLYNGGFTCANWFVQHNDSSGSTNDNLESMSYKKENLQSLVDQYLHKQVLYNHAPSAVLYKDIVNGPSTGNVPTTGTNTHNNDDNNNSELSDTIAGPAHSATDSNNKVIYKIISKSNQQKWGGLDNKQTKQFSTGNNECNTTTAAEEYLTCSSSLPWQQLLSAPPQQVIVVERMHSGAKRHVVLDFGQPILLTDILIPSCSDLISLTVDVWLYDENTDLLRVCVSTDIGTRNLIINDLQPPPLCRYLKIIAMGRYGMSTVRCKIPLGYFFGHMVVLPEDLPKDASQISSHNDLEKQLSILSKLFEDISCRYSLACSKLKEILQPFLLTDVRNISHLFSYMNVMRDRTNANNVGEHTKVFNAYYETITYQHQMNVVRNVMNRIENSLKPSKENIETEESLSHASTDKLTKIAESILELLLSINATANLDLTGCRELFNAFCVCQSSRLQLFTALFLDKSCNQCTFWGNFLADFLSQMFATSCTSIFPQDRLFTLLAFLSRKCNERSSIIDAALRILSEAINPLLDNRKPLLAVSVDLPLISWILMYLSLQLDLSFVSAECAHRWDWVNGELMGKTRTEPTKGRGRKIVCGRQTGSSSGSSLNWVKYTCPSPWSSNELFKSEKLSKIKYIKKASIDNDSGKKQQQQQQDLLHVSSANSKSFPKRAPQSIDVNHCLIVGRKLLHLILCMDHSGSADVILLGFKCASQLAMMAKLQLSQLINDDQLLNLVNFCTSSSIPWTSLALQCFLQDILDISSQSGDDVEMETDLASGNNWLESDLISDLESIEENWWKLQDKILSGSNSNNINNHNNNNNSNNGNYLPLPSVFESEDSGLEDILEDIHKMRKCGSKKESKTVSATAAPKNGNTLSSAIDQRLESSVLQSTEMAIKRLMMKNRHILMQNLSVCNLSNETVIDLPPWPNSATAVHIEATQTTTGEPQNNKCMLSKCFQTLFANICNEQQRPSYIEDILELWIALSYPAREKFDTSIVPTIPLRSEAVCSLISAMTWGSSMSMSTWCLALEALTIACNINTTTAAKAGGSNQQMVSVIINHPEFVDFIMRFISGSGISFECSNNVVGPSLVGPTLCKAMNDFIIRLEMRCDAVNPSPNNRIARQLVSLFLRIIYQMASPSGPIALKQGPLDAQCKLLQSFLFSDFTESDLSIAMSILQSTAAMVYHFVLHTENNVNCSSSSDKQNSMSGTFSDIFASVLGGDSTKQDRQVTHEDLLINLMKLLTKMVMTLPANSSASTIKTSQCDEDNAMAMETETAAAQSQTDESKAEQLIQHSSNDDDNSNMRMEIVESNTVSSLTAPPLVNVQPPTMMLNTSPPIFADIILQHHPTVIRLCHALAACKSSSLCMLANVSSQKGGAFPHFSEPNSISDAVFQLLGAIVKKASTIEVVMHPLLIFLSQGCQLSEPLLWFILQVLNTEEAIKSFHLNGGVAILGRCFVKSSSKPSTVAKSGTISAVMQHFGNGSNSNTNDTNINNNSSAAAAAAVAAATSTSMKKMQLAMENKLSLINFAPFCTIKCPSSTAQPADLLIQSISGVTHRRPRSPLWSYHFYPDETYTELILSLPNAVLIKEVQLQPHCGNLATCPSAVALELSQNGPNRLVPVCSPMSTSGMTYIRLHLTTPKIANCVLIRLYKPRDANSIGLLQIRLLGATAFNSTSTSNSSPTQPIDHILDDEFHTKHTLGWLRLLHHCLTISATNEDLKKQIVAAASVVPNLLQTCCGLLLVPSHVLPVYLPCLEQIVKELSLFSISNGVETIRILLDNHVSTSEIALMNNADSGSYDGLINTYCDYQSACEILHQICEHQDSNTAHRIFIILEWLQSVCDTASATVISCSANIPCNPSYISTIASILWMAKQSHVSYDLQSLVTMKLFETVYRLKTLSHGYLALKYALDSLLCAICYIRSEYYPILLEKCGVLVPNMRTDHSASISDDRKDSSLDISSATDDHKRTFEMNSEWYGHLVVGQLNNLYLSYDDLETIALVSRSPSAIQQLLDSGLPKILTNAIYEFCSKSTVPGKDEESEGSRGPPMATLENVTSILKFFTGVSEERMMRDWLGSSEGSSFWLHLLHWLCKRPSSTPSHQSNLQSEAHLHLEEVCVKFLAKCCICHPTNQTRLAKVLCQVIELQTNGISGFMRRLILQLLLENEKIPVCIQANETIYKNNANIMYCSSAYMLPIHPAFKQTYNRTMLYLNTNTTLLDILEQHIYFNDNNGNSSNNNNNNNSTNFKLMDNAHRKTSSSTSSKNVDVIFHWFNDEGGDLSMAAGATAKDKRAKDAKNQMMTSSASSSSSIPQSKKKRYASEPSTLSAGGGAIVDVGGRLFKCDTYSDQPLPLSLNLGQLLKMIESASLKTSTNDWPCIHLTIVQSKGGDEKGPIDSAACNNSNISGSNSSTSNIESNSYQLSNNNQPPICSALQVFSSMGGLALLAQHLPTVYPEAVRLQHPEPNQTSVAAEPSDSDWIKVEDCDYEDIEDTAVTSSPSKFTGLTSHIPPHSLTAFGLFLRLPGYAEVLLQDMRKALCLLRLVLGVTDDGEGGNIFQSPIADSLPTLPFEVLRKLYEITPLTTDDGRLLRRLSINIGIVHLLLACLSIFTHSQQAATSSNSSNSNNESNKDGQRPSEANNSKAKEDRAHSYWAKGTGFGTGSTQQSWNVEQALLKQRSEEEHVTILLQTLACFINPNDDQQAVDVSNVADDEANNSLPAEFHDLLSNSCLLQALSSYLRNDSVLDMARHIPLYKAVLQLLRALANSSQLVDLLLPQRNGKNEPSISSLLRNMKTCVDTYASKLRMNSKAHQNKLKSKLGEQLEELEQGGEGLATLMPDIQNTASIVSKVTKRRGLDSDNDNDRENLLEKIVFTSLEDQYLKIMKPLQFGSFEMITELPNGDCNFVVSYHFENSAKTTGEQSHPARVKRIAQEAVTLSTSLPLSYSSSVFVRYDTSRLDVMKVLITGPADTPYMNGCFEFDVFFPADYPLSPMLINLETTGRHNVRFNPNLYNDGKVCLSVLNTWHGRPEEKWNAQTSSFLQVLVSIQSLILVPEPYFNEPGYERAQGTPAGTANSREYNLNICQSTVKWAMLEQILNPCPCFKDVIQAHFYLKRHEIIAQVERWLADVESEISKEKKSSTSRGNKKSPATTLEQFKKVYQQLKEQLMNLNPPAGVGLEPSKPVVDDDNTDLQNHQETIATENQKLSIDNEDCHHSDSQKIDDTDIEMENKIINNDDMCADD